MRAGIRLAVLGVVIARMAAAVWAARSSIHGDYYASMPGAYVRTLNPTLWNSPDLKGASGWGYQAETYFHGPVQYLTLYPLAFLDSYQQIAAVLLPLYVLVLGVAFWIMRQTLVRLAPGPGLTVPLLASTFVFFPLLQAFIQREFEVVVLVALAGALWLLIHDRRNVAAALLGYVAWFKYAPLVFVGYLGLRGWFKAVASFVAASVVILGLAHAVFGLELFVNNNVPAHAVQVLAVSDYGFRVDQNGHLYGTGFCQGWFDTETTLANVRHGLCTLATRLPWLAPNIVYLMLCGAVAVIYLLTHYRLRRAGTVSKESEAWRRALEFSIVTTAYTCFLFNHYYYLIVLIIPLNVLLARYLSSSRPWHLTAWAVAYFLIAAFVVPMSVLTRLTGLDVWAMYIKSAWFLPGELMLMGLLLREYWGLGGAKAPPLQRREAGLQARRRRRGTL